LVSLGFVDAKSDTLLFVYHRGADSAYLLLYVDNIVLTASSLKLLQHTTSSVSQKSSGMTTSSSTRASMLGTFSSIPA
jgi:hypothetical protein